MMQLYQMPMPAE
jgi:hypothetical protein